MSDPDLARFSRAQFDNAEADCRLLLCRDLAEVLARRFASSGVQWADAAYAIVEDLRALGHDLWSFDEDADFQIWGGDYAHPDTAGRLHLMFHPPSEVQVWWHGGHPDCVSVRVGECARGPHE